MCRMSWNHNLERRLASFWSFVSLIQASNGFACFILLLSSLFKYFSSLGILIRGLIFLGIFVSFLAQTIAFRPWTICLKLYQTWNSRYSAMWDSTSNVMCLKLVNNVLQPLFPVMEPGDFDWKRDFWRVAARYIDLEWAAIMLCDSVGDFLRTSRALAWHPRLF